MRALWLPLVLITSLLISSGCHRSHAITYRIVAPNDYVGWVRVDFGGNSPASLDSDNTITINIGEDGTARTDSVPLMARTYTFYYQSPTGLQPIPESLVDHGIDAGGFSSGSTNGRDSVSWYFFIGPRTYRDQHPYKEFVSHASPLPTPGRMTQR